jgi:outer membrane protein OmpA-like peptidoglycan-associated protein
MDGETNVWKRNENKYKLKVGVSMTDLGGVKFSKGGQSGDFIANTTNWDISKLDFGTTPIAALDDTLSARFGGNIGGANYKMNLPTAFSTQIDYHIWKDLYINQTNFFAFGFNSNANKVHDFTTISVTPRWDHRIAGVSIPISYNSLMGARTGLALRLGPVTFGTSSVYPYRAFLRGDGFGKKDITGLDAYVLVRIPIAYKRIKDRDSDKVSDHKDQCVKVPGTWEYRGCPDRDGDHIRDEEDDCPDVPGLAALHGCPDKDGDGVTDLKDDCPDEIGLAIFNGCPDRDSDGVMDRIDDCPDNKGLVQYNGCPDTDGDNIMDKVDQCPTVYGIAELKGCPAAELTYFNVETQVEKVKHVGGVYSYVSAVETKTAKFKLEGYNTDTLKTVFVTAPNLRGKNAYREADGFFRFAKEAEVVILKEEEKQVMKKAFENLEYKTNSDVILSTSFSSLDELAKLMEMNSTWKLRISGHTDNVGPREANVGLSKRRSESVKTYLMTKGIASDRFEVLYFGPDKPIAPNNTEDGRARNRRVEMLIVE